MPNRAPGQLGLIQDFVNTLEVDTGRDDIGTAAALGAWLGARGLLRDEPATEPDRLLFRELREALRRLLVANNGGLTQDADLEVLNRLAAGAGLRPRFLGGGRVVLQPGEAGIGAAVGGLLAAVSDAMHEGTWRRLKACADHSCRWAFYDRSKNRSGHWCSMEVCGNRSKARQLRRRRKAATS